MNTSSVNVIDLLDYKKSKDWFLNYCHRLPYIFEVRKGFMTVGELP